MGGPQGTRLPPARPFLPCRVASRDHPFPGGPGEERGLPAGMRPPILFLARQKENAPGGREKALGRTGGVPVRKYDGRANRPAPVRRPRRPCAGDGPAQDCGPAFDGAAEGRGAGPHLPLLLYPRVPRRYALPGQLRKILPTAAQLLRAAGLLAGAVGADSISACRFGGCCTKAPQGEALKSGAWTRRGIPPGQRVTRGKRRTGKSDDHPDPPPQGPCGSRAVRLPG